MKWGLKPEVEEISDWIDSQIKEIETVNGIRKTMKTEQVKEKKAKKPLLVATPVNSLDEFRKDIKEASIYVRGFDSANNDEEKKRLTNLASRLRRYAREAL